MENNRKRYIALIAILVLTSLFVNFLSYDTYPKAEAGIQAIENIPFEIGEWHGKEIPLKDLVYEILETKSVIHRIYNAEGKREIFLSVVYFPEAKVEFHPPENCLGGLGVQTYKSSRRVNLAIDGNEVNITLNQLVWQNDDTESLVYYFYKADKFLEQSYIILRLRLAINKFTKKNKSASLIRFSTPIFSNDIEKASTILNDFLNNLYPFLIKYL